VKAHQSRVTCLSVRLSSGGLVMVTGGEDKRVIVWRSETQL